jgi:hypothetical protein
MSTALRNFEIPVRVPPRQYPIVIAAELSAAIPDAQLAAIICSHDLPDAIAPGIPATEQTLSQRIVSSRSTAQSRRRPIFAYCDDGRGFIDTEAGAVLTDTDWIGWPFYWNDDESSEDRDARYRAALDHARGTYPLNPIVIVVGASTRGFLSTADVAENIIACSRLVAEYGETICAPWFADGRGQGPSEFPELIPYLDAFTEGATGTPPIPDLPWPPIPPIPPIPPPGLRVKKGRFPMLPTNRCYLQTFEGETIEVDPTKPEAIILNPAAKIDPQYGGGWGELKISDPDAQGRRKLNFHDAGVTFTIGPDGSFQTRPEAEDGAWQRLVLSEQPYTVTAYRDVLAFVPFDPPAYDAKVHIPVIVKLVPIQNPV